MPVGSRTLAQRLSAARLLGACAVLSLVAFAAVGWQAGLPWQEVAPAAAHGGNADVWPVPPPQGAEVPTTIRLEPASRVAAQRGQGVAVSPPTRRDEVFCRLGVRAVDLDGVPVAGVAVFAAPPRQLLNRCGMTGSDGEFELFLRSEDEPLELLVELRGAGGRSLTGLRPLTVPVGGQTLLELVLDPTLVPEPATRVPADGVEHASTRGEAGRGAGALQEPSVTRLPDGTARFERQPDGTGALALDPGASRGPWSATEAVVIPETARLSEELELSSRTRAVVHGHVRDQHGRSAAGVRVALETCEGRTLVATRSAVDGTFLLVTPPGRARLRAGGAARGSSADVDLATGTLHEWNPMVRRLNELTVTLPADSGMAQLEASVRVFHAKGETLHVAVAPARGGVAVTVACPPAPRFDVHVVRGPLSPSAIVDRFEDVTPSDAWRPVLAPPARLSLFVYDGGTVPSELRLFEPGLGRGTRSPVVAARAGALVLEATCRPWLLELGTADSGWSRPQPVELMSGAELWLGMLGPE
jgi:hypothetical protein